MIEHFLLQGPLLFSQWRCLCSSEGGSGDRSTINDVGWSKSEAVEMVVFVVMIMVARKTMEESETWGYGTFRNITHQCPLHILYCRISK